jgi:hypothetical protein
MCCLHPIDPAEPKLLEPCRTLPKCARDHVYVFFVHGMDPCDCANLTGLRDYVQSLGFSKTYYGQMFHTLHFETVVQQIHKDDPEARFVLVGFSFGANFARDICQSAKKEGIPVDLLVYLGGNTLSDGPKDQPENACKIVNILATGCIWNGDTLEHAENIQVQGVWHFGSPTHPQTLEVLARELAVVAARVPVPPATAPTMPPADETAPTPRPVQAQKPAPRDEWDFLKPVSRLERPKINDQRQLENRP